MAARRPLLCRARPLRCSQVESNDEGRVYRAHGVDLVRGAAKRRHVTAHQTERLDGVRKQGLARIRRERAVGGTDRANGFIHVCRVDAEQRRQFVVGEVQP